MADETKTRTPWNKGRSLGPQTTEHREKISMALTGLFVCENGPRWKGEQAGYQSKHVWIRKYFGKATKCEYKDCVYPRKRKRGKADMMTEPTRFEWANISKKYKRVREDWVQLCKSCHSKLDHGSITL
jgi:hypothetical protein